MKMKMTFLTIICSLILLSQSFCQSKNDSEQIKSIITQFASGIDQQKGSMISNTFRDGAGFYATNNRDKIITVTPQQLADMHEAKKFGGRNRNLKIEDLNVTDDIVAAAKVIAQDNVVYYAYYMTFSKINNQWLIQSVLQHSKKL